MSDTTNTVDCPTCGSACLVAGSVTHSFIPAAPPRITELETQLSERDAALARCVEALKAIEAIDRKRNYLTCPDCDDDSCSTDTGCKVAKYSLVGEKVVDALASLHTSAQATAKVLAAAREMGECDIHDEDRYKLWDRFSALQNAIREEGEGK